MTSKTHSEINHPLTQEQCATAVDEVFDGLRLLNLMDQLDMPRWNIVKRRSLQKKAAFLVQQEIAKDTVQPQDILASVAGDRRPVRLRKQ